MGNNLRRKHHEWGLIKIDDNVSVPRDNGCPYALECKECPFEERCYLDMTREERKIIRQTVPRRAAPRLYY